MAQRLRFDGKVVLVTGAGNGLGRTYALAFAERGASVVVNDLGCAVTGTGAETKAADKVVFEIKSKGGKAVANYNSVEDGDKVVQTALDAFGKIDVVVNNAGILRDKSFGRMSDDDWDLIHRVHLRGTFMVTRAAWPHMRKQGYGRIITISSPAGLYGNFGQANYAAAKMGLIAFSNTLSMEGAKYNITCNSVAPFAGSRMTDTVLSPDVVQALKPEYVSPLIEYLCHESTKVTGEVFEVGAGWLGKVRWQRAEGAVVGSDKEPMTAEMVRDNWDKITDFSNHTYPKTTADSSYMMIQLLKNRASQADPSSSSTSSSSSPITVDGVRSVKAHEYPPFKYSYTERDLILYALGVGVSTTQPDHLKFVFELNDEFSAIPSFGVIPAFAGIMQLMENKIPGFEVNPVKVLHGEQYLELFKPIPRSGTLTSRMRVVDVLDKKSGAVILLNVETYDEKNEKVALNQFSTFVVGSGNYGGASTSDHTVAVQNAPKRKPDATMQENTSIDQAALYRLSGDNNPLHIDGSFAAMAGFSTPILHGLCTFGHSVRHVMTTYANNDMNRFKAVKVRFAKPVLPGQTLRTEMWKEGNRIHFQTKVVESGTVCIASAYVDLFDAASVDQPTQGGANLKSTAVFESLATQIKAQPKLAAQINATFLWNITVDGKTAANWTIDLKNKNEVYEGMPKSGKADTTITLADTDFVDLVSGKLNAQKAFMSGKLKIKGNMMIMQKLGDLFSTSSKL